MKKSHKVGIAATLLSVCVFGEMGQADAFIKLPGPLQGLWDQSFGIVTKYAGFALEKSLIKGLDDLAGDFNLPDPAELWGWLDKVADGEEEAIDGGVGEGLTKGSVKGQQAANLAKSVSAATIGSVHADSNLSKDGQNANKKLAKDIADGANNAADCASKGSKLVVTQKIQIQSLCIQNEQTRLLANMSQQQIYDQLQNSVDTKMRAENLKIQAKQANQEKENMHQSADATVGHAAGLKELFSSPGQAANVD